MHLVSSNIEKEVEENHHLEVQLPNRSLVPGYQHLAL